MSVLGIYPGCSLSGTAREYNESVMALCQHFNIELKEVPDWNCCGASAAHQLNTNLGLSLSLRILALAEKAGITELIVPCAACYSRLMTAQHEVEKDAALRQQIVSSLQMEYTGHVKILNVLEFIGKHIKGQLSNHIAQPFNYQVACYYGCLLVRPHDIVKFDRVENPQIMDETMQAIGAKAINWAFKTECCGAGMSVSRTKTVARLSGKIMEDAMLRNAQFIVVACPMCHSNLDMRRPDIEKAIEKKCDLPVIYITQAIGLAVGIEPKKLGLHRHFVPFRLPESVQLS